MNCPTTSVTMEDVGVLLIGYNRPDFLQKRILEIKGTQVINLYICIDGGRESKTAEMEKFKALAKTELTTIPNLIISHESQNLGLVRHITSKISYVFQKHQYIIVIEDDVKISSSFIFNMLQGLNYFSNKRVLGVVSGWSPIVSRKLKNKWRISKYQYIWGWSTSRDVWDDYKYDLSALNFELNLNSSKKWNKLNRSQKKNWLGKFKKIKRSPLHTWDIQFYYHCLQKEVCFLSPLFSLTGNEGFNDSRAVHTKGKVPRLINNYKLSSKNISTTSFFLSKIIYIFDKVFYNDIVVFAKARILLNKLKI